MAHGKDVSPFGLDLNDERNTMGMYLSASVGVGVLLPQEEDESFSKGFQAILDSYSEEHGEDDFGEALYQLVKKYPLLSLQYGGYLEYNVSYCVMVKSTVTRVWDSMGSIDPAKFSISNEEFDQLANLISALGYEKVNPEIIVAASYG